LVSSGDFAHEILSQLQIALWTGQADMAKIRGQQWQLRTEVNVLFAPQKKPQAGKRMTKVMESDACVACALNTCNYQRLVESGPEGGDGIAPSAWTWKQGDMRKGGFEMPGCNSPALKE
jgi:hypothetical protein